MLRGYHLPLKDLILFGLILGTALMLRLYRLGHENFWADEIAYMQDASQNPSDIVNYWTAARMRLHHVTPLPHLVTHFFISPEKAELSMRLPSAIFGTLEVLVLFVLGSRLFSYHIGLLSALLLALSPLHLWYSQEARWYAQWSLVTSSSYLALLYVWRNDRGISWLRYGLTAVLNAYTFIYSGLVIAMQTIAVCCSRRARVAPGRFLFKFFLVNLLVGGAALPVLWAVLRGLDKSSGTPRPVGLGDLPYTFFSYAAGFSVGPTLAELHALPNVLEVIADHPIVLVYAGVYLPAIFLGVRQAIRSPDASALVLPWIFGLPVLVFLIACATNLTYQVRYTLPALPAFVLILSCGVLSLQSKTAKVGLISAMLLGSLFSISNFYWNTRYDKAHIRAAIARIKALDVAKSPILTIGQIGGTASYYGNGLNIVVKSQCDGAEMDDLLREESSNGSRIFWLLSGRDWDNRAAACLGKLSHFYSVISHERFTGTDLWLLERRE